MSQYGTPMTMSSASANWRDSAKMGSSHSPARCFSERYATISASNGLSSSAATSTSVTSSKRSRYSRHSVSVRDEAPRMHAFTNNVDNSSSF